MKNEWYETIESKVASFEESIQALVQDFGNKLMDDLEDHEELAAPDFLDDLVKTFKKLLENAQADQYKGTLPLDKQIVLDEGRELLVRLRDAGL